MSEPPSGTVPISASSGISLVKCVMGPNFGPFPSALKIIATDASPKRKLCITLTVDCLSSGDTSLKCAYFPGKGGESGVIASIKQTRTCLSGLQVKNHRAVSTAFDIAEQPM